MRIVSLSVTEQGRQLSCLLPYESHHGDIAARVASKWDECDGLLLFLSVGAAVRIIAPLLASKASDPAVVCVDEAGQYVIPVLGGHHGRTISANDLARSVADVLGAEAVVTTATDAVGAPSLHSLPGFIAGGDVARVTRAMLDGQVIEIENPNEWPVPAVLGRYAGGPPGSPRVLITDSCVVPQGAAVIHPPSLVIGVGADTMCEPEELDGLVMQVLATASLAPESVTEIATIDRRASDPALVQLAASLDATVQAFGDSELARVSVPNPSPAVERAVGTPSVAEAAALLAACPSRAALLVPKVSGRHCTVAVARRANPRGSLAVVGLGPGSITHRTPAVETAVRHAEVVVGYAAYIEQCTDLVTAAQTVLPFHIGEEAERCRRAVEEASAGRSVALVCSGDPGVYAMAPVVLTLAGPTPDFDIHVIPGISAAYASAALVGAPLAHDHVLISLSDLTTPWEIIADRVAAAATSGMAIAIYNPRSGQRSWQLGAALGIIAKSRPASTPVALVTDAMRSAQQVVVTTLGELAEYSTSHSATARERDADPGLPTAEGLSAGVPPPEYDVTMTTCVIVGASDTEMIGQWMVTPRGLPVRTRVRA